MSSYFPSTAQSMFINHEEQTHFLSSSSCAPYLLNRADDFQPDDDTWHDDCDQLLGEKKRRLSIEQVRALEKSFELGNKLDSERKMELARGLGLQPRQIAIWFQNRRARWKTKQLEKDYDTLRRRVESIKADNDALKNQNKKLHSQLMALKSRETTKSKTINLNKKNVGLRSNGNDEDNCEVNLNTAISIDTTFYLHQSNENAVVFPSSIGTTAAATLSQLLPCSFRSDHSQGNKIDHTPTSDEPFCNVFVGVEESPGFWAWPEQQNFQ
ncbi:hypothetical protein BUALT_Bualt16G0008600 [Buddleja alternifolia]|uniref:Homeobox-leucine zipper protein n=1 Tax=Buddleja alternifolia TaxID=168488 RepID=A0AAV6WGE3_9LAMI|nr:hypothetical protein BUALT_Bualt16G0008600 [Buddleja alternifolia]